MGNIILVAESGADIPVGLAREYGIYIVPMHISFGAESKPDGTFPPEEISAYYERTGVLPKTSGSTPEDYSRVFDEIHRRYPGGQILHLAYSAVTTCSYQSARLAAEGRDYVTSVDTKFASGGQAAIVLRTARLLREHPEMHIKDAAKAVESLIRRNHMCFIPDKLEFLRAGGRLKNTTALVGNILSIHPLIEFDNGEIKATRKLRGKMERLIPQLIANYTEENRFSRDEIWLLHSPGLAEECRTIAHRAARDCGFPIINWIKTGGVITCHGGPGAFGIAGFSG